MGLKRFTAPQYNFSTNSSIKLTLVTVTWDEKVEEKQNKTSRILLKDLKTVCQCFIYLVATLENGLQWDALKFQINIQFWNHFVENIMSEGVNTSSGCVGNIFNINCEEINF